MGRPRKFNTVKELDESIEKYFEKYKDTLSISGLALHLGFESRQSFYDYEKESKFSYSIKRARLSIENFYETKLTGNNVAGSIFALKNFGWRDKQDIEHSGGVKVINDDIK